MAKEKLKQSERDRLVAGVTRPGKADFDELTDVWEKSVRATHHFLQESDIAFLRRLVREQYLNQVDLYALRGADNRITAFMGVKDRMLEMLFVHPAEIGKGLGKMLVCYAVECLGIYRVDVNEQNGRAAGFYEYLGFAVVGRDEKDGLGLPFPILHLELKRWTEVRIYGL